MKETLLWERDTRSTVSVLKHPASLLSLTEGDFRSYPAGQFSLTWPGSTRDFLLFRPRFLPSFQLGECIWFAGLIPCSRERKNT